MQWAGLPVNLPQLHLPAHHRKTQSESSGQEQVYVRCSTCTSTIKWPKPWLYGTGRERERERVPTVVPPKQLVQVPPSPSELVLPGPCTSTVSVLVQVLEYRQKSVNSKHHNSWRQSLYGTSVHARGYVCVWRRLVGSGGVLTPRQWVSSTGITQTGLLLRQPMEWRSEVERPIARACSRRRSMKKPRYHSYQPFPFKKQIFPSPARPQKKWSPFRKGKYDRRKKHYFLL